MRNRQKRRTRRNNRGTSIACDVCGVRTIEAPIRIRGFERTVCGDCRRLGEDTIDYKGCLNELRRCVTWDGLIPKKMRRRFELILRHNNPQIARLAKEFQVEDDFRRQISKAGKMRDYDRVREIETEYEAWIDAREERLDEHLRELYWL